MKRISFLFAVSVLLTLAFLIGALPTSIFASSAAETADTLETAEPVLTDGGGGAGKTITPLTVMMYYLHGGYTTSGGVFPLRDGSDLTLMGDAAFCAQHEKSTPYNGVEMAYVGKMSDYLEGDLTDGLTALWAYRVIKAAQGLMNNSSYSALTVYQKLQAIQIAINNPDRLHSSYSNGEAGGSYTETQAKQMYALYEAIDRAARASNLQLPTEKPLTYTRTGGDYFSGANYVLATYRLNYPNVTARSVSSSPNVACSVSGDTLTVSVPADRMGGSLYYGIALSAPTQTVETIDLYAEGTGTRQKLLLYDEYDFTPTASVGGAVQMGNGRLEIRKVDAANPGQGLAGAVFQVRNRDTGSVTLLPATDSSGYTSLEQMKIGRYTVSEKTPPEGYTLSDWSQDFVITAGSTAKLSYTVTNHALNAAWSVPDLRKTLNSAAPDPAGQYTFELLRDGEVIDTQTDRPGTSEYSLVHFGEIAFTGEDAGKTYLFTIREKNTGIDGVVYDTAVAEWRVTVSESDGSLSVSAVQTKFLEDNTFKNYTPSGSWTPTVRKVLEGATLTDGQFTFTLSEGGSELQRVTNRSDGSIPFAAIRYTAEDVGRHIYVIRELPGDDGAVSYDGHEVTVTVNVEFGGGETLSASVESVSGNATFTNRYSKSGSWTPTVRKSFPGGNLTDGMFTFILSEDGREMQRVSNKADGTVPFGPIEYTSADVGEHIYTVREVNDARPGVVYDAHTLTYTVRVSDLGDSELTVYVSSDGSATFTNRYETEITVRKVWKDNSDYWHIRPKTVTLTLTGSDGSVRTATLSGAGDSWSYTFTHLPKYSDGKPIVYTVREKPTVGYLAAVDGYTVTNSLQCGDLAVTKTSEDGLVEGMKFHLYGTSLGGATVDEYAVTEKDGIAHFRDIPIGSGYTLEEVDTPDRYVIPDKQTADIEWNKVTNKDFENNLKRGDLTVTKTAEDGLQEGLRFHLYGKSYSGLSVDEYATVGSDGKAYFTDILIGKDYVLEEVGSPDRYVIPDVQGAVVEWNTVTQKSVDNPLKKWNLTVTKRDSETGKPQGDGSLAGAVYGIYQDGELIDRYTTDESGCFTTKWYICGDNWTLREITPSEGYLIDPTEYHIGAEAKNYTVEYNAAPAVGSPEDIIKGKIAIIKHTDDGSTKIETPEVGAVFEVYLKSAGSYAAAKETERDCLVCDENGFAKTKELPYGVYTVYQVSGWDGRELLPDFDVYVSEDGQVYRYLINNSTFEALVRIVKKDAETGKTIPAAGIGFKVRNRDTGEYIVQHLNYPTPVDIDTFYTDESGMLMLPEPLPYGNYEIIEVQTAYGYVLDGTPVPFTVDGTLATVTVEKHNFPQKGKITVTKTGEVFSSVVQSGDIYQPVYEVQGLPGAVYEIIAAEDIYTPDGTLRYAKGTVVDTVTTGADGNAVSKALYLGKYEVREIAAPYGMVLNGETHTVELTYAGQEIEITETATSFYNDRQRVQIDLSKVMEQDETFGIGNNGEILSVQFGLFAAEDLTAADGTRIPKDGLIETVTCDESGYAVFATDIPVGAKLYMKEIATDSRYILSDDVFPVEFAYAGQNTAIVHITVNDGESIENEILRGDILGHKTDRETGENITGAVFGLFASDTAEYTEDNAILTAVTGEDGVFKFEDIPYGSYVVVELTPAEGYLPNTEPHYVHVTADAEIIEISVINDRIPEIGTTATVGGEKSVEAKGEITIEDIVSYKNLTPGKEYTVSGVLINKATGEPFTLNGEEIRSDVTFTPETADGEVTVTFTFNADGITKETEAVVLETLYREDVEIAVHADIEDDGQTVTLLPPPPDNPKTGDDSHVKLWFALAVLSALGTVVCAVFGFKKKKEGE